MSFCTNCGEKIEENQQVCTKCGSTLTSSEKKKSSKKFFAPLDYSDVRSILPEGAEIIYSAVFNVSYTDPRSQAMYPEEFKTHVLFTKNGIVYQKGGLKVNEYLPWNKLAQIHTGGMMVKKKLTVFNFMLYTIPEYETPEEFSMRPWQFYFEFAPHLINEKIKHHNSYNLKKIQKMYTKYVDILGEEEIEFIRTTNDYEEFKKHHPKLKDAMLKATPKWAKGLVKRFNLIPEL